MTEDILPTMIPTNAFSDMNELAPGSPMFGGDFEFIYEANYLNYN